MKYIDADLLQKDIDELKNAMTDVVGKYADGFRFALEHFTFLIAHYSQQEQQEAILPKRDTEDIFAHEYAIYSLPPFVVESIAYGTQLIDFIYKTAHHFYELGKNSK